MLNKWIVLYLCFMNILAVLICAFDKIAAVRHWRRVPEKTLFWLAGLGGGAGMYLCMRFIRHKTLHKRFMVGIPAIIAAQVILICVVIHLTK